MANVQVIRRYFRYLFVVLLLLCASLVALTWYAASDLIAPPRLALQPYQTEWIAHPEMHGVLLRRFDCNQGLTPCLFVEADANTAPGEKGEILRRQLLARGVKLAAYGHSRAIMVLLHGRKGRKENLLAVAERFAAIGFKCVIADLPAHGDSPIKTAYFGLPLQEQALIRGVLKDARAYFIAENAPAAIWGISMGGSYAIQSVTANPSDWSAAIVVASFDQLTGVIEDQFKEWPLLVRDWLLEMIKGILAYKGLEIEAVNSLASARNIKIPVFVVHGDHDALINMRRGKNLFDAFASVDKRWLQVKNADHNTVLVTSQPVFADSAEWLLKLPSFRIAGEN